MNIFEHLTKLLQAQPDILVLGLVGSRQQGTADEWSDWDGVIVAENETVIGSFFADLDWASALGEVLAWSQSKTEFTQTLRLCFADFQRLDLIFTTPLALAQLNEWPRISFWRGAKVIFARSAELANMLTATYPPSPFESFSLEQLHQLANEFFFKAQLAVFKIGRDDRLIALHLILDLMQDVAVLAMLIRDEQTQTTHHLTGGWGNEVVDGLRILKNYQRDELLKQIDELGHVFDGYAQQLQAEYKGKSHILSVFIEQLR